MAPRRNWKLLAFQTMVLLSYIMIIFYWVDILLSDARQRAQHECKSFTNKCDPNAYCYGNNTSYVCMCKSRWNGDGFVGDGHSGCQWRQLSKLWLAAFIIAFILAALVLLWILVDAIWRCIRCTRLRARIGNSSQEALAQQAYPRQGVAPGPVEAV